MTALWPPLSQIRAELLGPSSTPDASIPIIQPAAEPRPRPPPGEPVTPLIELARRRQAAKHLFSGQSWEAGCVVLVPHGHTQVGVLLDQHDPSAKLWQGWVVSAEPDWAVWHDVLLEEDDGAFDPSASVVQAWNRVRVFEPPRGSAVLARLKADRLAAVRSVWAESQQGARPASRSDVEPAPGHVALRETPDGHMVLTGTPLGTNDPRLEHQALYRELGHHLIESALAASTPPPKEPASPSSAAPSWWSRLRSFLRSDGLVRPAFALLALVVVAQQWMLWQGGEEDEVRFRGGTPPATSALVVRWEASTRVSEAEALLKNLSAHTNVDILPEGRWYIEVDDPANARTRLMESGLVQSAEQPR